MKISFFIISIAALIFCVTPIKAQNREVQIGIPFVADDVLQQDARLLFGGRVNNQNIFIISKKKRYIDGIRSGTFDAFFAKANLGSWAIENHPYEVVAKLQEPLFLRLIVRNDELDIFEYQDLSHRSICTEDSPDLTFYFLQTLFTQAESLSKRLITYPQKEIKNLLERNCIGVVVNESRLKLSTQKKDFVTLARSEELSQIAFFVRKDLNVVVREHLMNRLFSAQATFFVNDLKAYFSTPSDTLIPTNNDDYKMSPTRYSPTDWSR